VGWSWHQQIASGMQDVSAPVNAIGPPVSLAGANGTIWRMLNSGRYEVDPRAGGFRRVAMSPDGVWLYGVGANGTVWYSRQPGVWTQVVGRPAIGPVEDAVVNYDNSLWVCTANGQMWSMRNGRDWEWRSVLDAFKRLAVGPGNQWWGITRTGLVMRRDGNLDDAHGYWRDTRGSGFEDVSVATDGTVWLVGSNGTVWRTSDGQSFTRIDAAGFRSISAHGHDVVWAVGTNGTLWAYYNAPDSSPPSGGSGGGGGGGSGGGGGGGGGGGAARLTLTVTDWSAHHSIAAVRWRLWRQDVGGLSELAPVAGAATSTTLPGNGQYQLHAEVWATPTGQTEAELASFVGNGSSINGVPTFTFVWSGVTQAKSFRLVAVEQDGIVNPVVAV
jgi:uncharacterized membrane protein YgcG